ncbi:conserved membrane protein [Mycobacterium marinum M]|uniref:Conserved membrane protein n=1 Tax=Mycobacterium marinum (strain ATCC BAA-535 / M) TaxID=216594 RepID=B2HJ38_MYCMM|nr:conserved membrane protein [Mycobacterium marinum M]
MPLSRAANVERRLIARGLLAGAVGAVLAFVFARLFAEPIIGRAVEFEDARTEAAHAHGVHEHGAELFSRGVQANAGLGFGVLIFGLAVGALFAVVFCLVYGRVGNPSASPAPRVLSIRLAALAFTVVYLVPFVKYPPNPPAVGQADTIGARTLWYLVMVVASVMLSIVAVYLVRWLSMRMDMFNAGLLAAGAYLVAVTVVMAILPTVAEIPQGFPADVLYEFRLVSLGTQLVLWASIGLVFSVLVGRGLDERADSGRVQSAAA